MERQTHFQKKKRIRRHGFRTHMKSHGGKKVLQKRRRKGRKRLTI